MIPEETAKAWRKLPKGKVLSFDRFTMQHSGRYEQGNASHPCGCYWCQSQKKVSDLATTDSVDTTDTANPPTIPTKSGGNRL